jgi:hypothetical protein
MADLSEQQDQFCVLCGEQECLRRSDYTPNSKHAIFHDTCQQCENYQQERMSRLCKFCRHLRLRHLLFCMPNIKNDYESLKLVVMPFRKESKRCDFCRLIAAEYLCECASGRLTKDERTVETLHNERLHLLFSNLGQGTFWIDGSAEGRCFRAILNDKAVSVEHFNIDPYSDWSWLRSWIDESRKVRSDPFAHLLQRQHLVDVLVVDVLQDHLVHLPRDSEYLALSYVWGEPSDATNDLQLLRSNANGLQRSGSLANVELPRTIADAFVACRRLGHRYLWVDRLCITQDAEPSEKLQQLAQMASIYHWATLTIVAASGKDATHGLTGVTRPRNVRKEVFNVADIVMI